MFIEISENEDVAKGRSLLEGIVLLEICTPYLFCPKKER